MRPVPTAQRSLAGVLVGTVVLLGCLSAERARAPGEGHARKETPPPVPAREDKGAAGEGRPQPKDGAPSAFDEAFARLGRGWFGVGAPAEMRVGDTARVRASVVRDELRRDLVQADLAPARQQKIEALSLGKELRVELKADERDFRIEALSEPAQPVLARETSVWEWDVTAKASGQRSLEVVATNLVDVEGKLIGKSQPVKTIVMRVRVNPVLSVMEFFRTGLGQVLSVLTALAGAIAAWLKLLQPLLQRRKPRNEGEQ